MDEVHAKLAFAFRRALPLAAFAVAVPLLLSCRKAGGNPALSDASQAVAPPPMEVQLNDFRRDIAEVSELEGGARTRDELVSRFVAALERADTAALVAMWVSRAEYAWLYFPTSIYMKKPYELPPDVAWMLNSENSEKGVKRVLRRLGGRDLAFRGYSCPQPALLEGGNRFWKGCTVRYDDPESGRGEGRLFGSIMERKGRFNFLSYANDF